MFSIKKKYQLCLISLVQCLILGSGVLYLVQLIEIPLSYSQQQNNKSEKFKFNRESCCLDLFPFKDVCGRPNCTRNCPEPTQPPIVELHNKKSERAFFIETSGSKNLNIRQACAVESLAFHNPSLKIYVLFMLNAGQISKNDQQITISPTIQELKEKYSNIQFVIVNMDDYVSGTTLEHWYHCTDWRNGPYHVSHLSDGLRFLTLYKYGGYYFDLDVILVRPVTHYHNFVAKESQYHLASNSIHADLNHPVMELATKNFAIQYMSNIWSHNGPALLLRVLKNWCSTDYLGSMDYVRCRGFNILSKSSFNPVHYENMKQLFIHRSAKEIGKPPWLTDQVIGVHTWNKLSYGLKIYKNSTQDYTRLARDNCPFTYSIAPGVF